MFNAKAGNVSIEKINRDILSLWDNYAKNYQGAERINIESELKMVEEKCLGDAKKYLYLPLALSDEALLFLIILDRYVSNFYEGINDTAVAVLIILINRIISISTSIRKLIVSGLEEACIILFRSLIENIEYSIVSLLDEDFAQAFFSNEPYNNDFWRNYVSNKKINKKIEEVLIEAEIDLEFVQHYIEHHNYLKNRLSSSVHPSFNSAFHATYIPSLSN